MTKFAVVKIQGSQFKVCEGDHLEVSRLSGKEGGILNFDSVLAISEEGKVKIGTPTVKGAKVSVKIDKQYQGEKLDVYKFKAKTGYHRHIGFRPLKTQITIDKITA